MNDIIEILAGYGALGCWVIFSIWQNSKREKQFQEERLRFQDERLRWNSERMAWLRTLGKKLSDDTIVEIDMRNKKWQ